MSICATMAIRHRTVVGFGILACILTQVAQADPNCTNEATSADSLLVRGTKYTRAFKSELSDPVFGNDALTATQSDVDASISQEGTGDIIEVACTFDSIDVEDAHPGDVHVIDDGISWGECTDAHGQTYYLEDSATIQTLQQESQVRLKLKKKASPERPELSLPWKSEGVPFYEVVEVKVLGTLMESDSVIEEIAQQTQVIKVLAVICNYNDHKVQYARDEQKIMDSLYLTEAEFNASGKSGKYPGSMSDMIAIASYGKLSLPRSEGAIVTVEMGTNWADEKRCRYNKVANIAKQKVIEQHPNVDWNRYYFKQFFIPDEPNGGCRWAGIAKRGCGHYSILGQHNNLLCYAWFRHAHPGVRAHELGHQLGLSHAGAAEGKNYVEYGDRETVMGASWQFTSYIVSARYQMGFLSDKPGEVVEWDSAAGARSFNIQTLSKRPGEPGADAIGIKFACPTCVPKVKKHKGNVGGYLWVQFRGDEGYSALHLPSEYQNKVYVHLARAYADVRSGAGSEMWARLGEAEQYATPDGRYVRFCSISGDVVKVSFGTSVQTALDQCTTPSPTPRPTPATPSPTPACADDPTRRRQGESCASYKARNFCTKALDARRRNLHKVVGETCQKTCGICHGATTPSPTPRPTPATPSPTPACADDPARRRNGESCASYQARGLCTQALDARRRNLGRVVGDTCPKTCGICQGAVTPAPAPPACLDNPTRRRSGDSCASYKAKGLCTISYRRRALAREVAQNCQNTCGCVG